jgi:ankyrin repeat protein
MLRRLILVLAMATCACGPQRPDAPRPPVVPVPIVGAAPSALGSTRSPGVAPPRQDEEPPDAETSEALIRSFQAAWRATPSADALSRFVADHPGLLRAKAKPYGESLMWALEFGEAEAAMALLRAGASVDTGRSDQQTTPLHMASRAGLDAVVVWLLRNGARPDAASYEGTPLHFAAKYGHAGTMALLLTAGAAPTVHAKDHGFTALHLATIGRHKEAVATLIRSKAELDAPDDDGRTALHWCALAYAPQAEHLYERPGAPHDTVFRDPGPAVIAEMLMVAGAKVEATDNTGDTPLHHAARLRAPRAAEMLLKHGAQRSARNKAGETALDIAKKNGELAMEKILRGP